MGNLVSIVLPVYNGEKYLKVALDSILHQTYKDWELICVNDCSTDNTSFILDEYEKKDKRIRVFTNKVNSKIPKSLNNGFKEARGMYYTWTSDDNILKEGFLEAFVTYMDQHSDTGLVYTDYEIIDENGKVKGIKTRRQPQWIPYYNTVGASFMYRADVAKEVGEYSTDLFLVEDYDYWIRIYLKSKVARLDGVFYQYRVHAESLTAKKTREIQQKWIELREKYYYELLLTIADEKIKLKFYASSRGYGSKKDRPGELKLAVKHPWYFIYLVYKIYKIKKLKISFEQHNSSLK